MDRKEVRQKEGQNHHFSDKNIKRLVLWQRLLESICSTRQRRNKMLAKYVGKIWIKVEKYLTLQPISKDNELHTN